MNKYLLLVFTLFLSIPLESHQQQKDKQPKLPPHVTKDLQAKIDKAIENGVKYLKKRFKDDSGKMEYGTGNLVLWTLLHAGLDEEHTVVQDLLKRVLRSGLNRTYNVALQALILNKLDKKKYQMRIAQCAQFLVDNQCENGQWGYGKPVPPNKDFEIPLETNKPKKGEDTFAEEIPPVKNLKKRQKGPLAGDNSNTQYAALGIKACFEAGVVFPKEVIENAKKWWEGTQNLDKGWNYNSHKHPSTAKGRSYGSMTVGGIGSLCIYKHMLKEDYKKDPAIIRGFQWLFHHYTFAENPGRNKNNKTSFQYYYLYGFERACGLFGTEWFYKRPWYKEGAEYILSQQKKDGSWSNGNSSHAENPTNETCFAILFLRRVTKPVKPPKFFETHK